MNAADYLEQNPHNRDNYLPDWLSAERQQARNNLQTSGFPTSHDEAWKYMAALPLQQRTYSPAPMPTQQLPENAVALYEHWYLPDAWVIVVVDGYFSPTLSRLLDLNEKIVLSGLKQALENIPERIQSAWLKQQNVDASYQHGLLHFNSGLFSDGVFLEVPRGVVLDKPLQLLQLSTRADGLANTHNLVIIGEGASAQFIETYVSIAGQSSMSSALTQLQLAPSATLEHIKVQAEAEQAGHFAALHVEQARSSLLIQHNITLGGGWVRNDIASELKHGAECRLSGLFLGQGRQYIDNHTRVVHAEPQGVSHQNYRGILMDRARGVFQGRIVVASGAQQTNADMNSRNLLLSADAEIDAKPQLEILADDVRCSHGFSVGDLAAESLFYLASRGIDNATARNMLIFAFANECVEKIGLASLRSRVKDRLLNNFPHNDIRREWL